MNRDSKHSSHPGTQPGAPKTRSDQPQQGGSHIQGEGDYDDSRRYRDSADQFAQQSGRVEQPGADAAPDSAERAEQMRNAEQAGRKKAKK